MNRQEALEKLEKFYCWDYGDERYSEEVAREHKQNLEDIIKYLKQPITLIDYSGWEENVEYSYCGERYKIIDNRLYYFDDRYNEWTTSIFNGEFMEFQKAKKIQPKKYYLRLKQKYRKFYGISNNLIYLNFNKETDKLSLLDLKPYKEYKTQFTIEEVEEIKKRDYIPFEQFELIEGRED